MASSISNQEIPRVRGFLAFINSLPKKLSTTIRIFQRNDYYTVHGSDAVFVAKEVFKTTSVVKKIGSSSQKTESVWLSKSNFESLIKDLLLIRQYRVEIYHNKGAGKRQEWSLKYKASPGNLTQFEEVLFGSEGTVMVDSKGVIAIKIKSSGKQQVIGVAYGDPILRVLKVSEFNDNSSFSELEAVLVQLSPKECLLASMLKGSVSDKVKQIVQRNNILISECKSGDFSAADITQALDRLVKSIEGTRIQSLALLETELKIAIQCIAALIKYFELLSDETNFGQFVLSSFNPQQYVRLDMSTVRALGVMPASTEDSKNNSLLGLLNKCRTPQGQRLLAQWIKQPLMDLKEIEERLDIVESFVNDSELRQSLFENHLRRIPDLHMVAKHFHRKRANLQDVYRVYAMVSHLPNLLECLSKHDGPHSYAIKATFCNDIRDRIAEFEFYLEMVRSVLDFSAVAKGEFIVKSESDTKLEKLRELMKESQSLIGREIDKVAEDLGLEANKTVKLEHCCQIGYYFRVTRKEQRALRGRKNYFTIDTKLNGLCFYNSCLRMWNEKYLSLRKSHEEYHDELVNTVIGVAATYCIPMKQLSETIAHLDVLVSFACAALNAPKPYIRPKLTQKGERGIILKQARHPCLEVQPNADFTPNSIEMEKGKHLFHIITGPNMSGKSTFMHSIALNVVMAQIGSFVPCDAAEISIVDAILTTVGTGNKPVEEISTFMAEMLEVKRMLKTATANSLIIVDELGRGTSTFDGLGLVWALSEYIAISLKSYCLFTTPFHELADLSDEIESVNNLHVTAATSEENTIFLYQVEPGVYNESSGTHVAEMTSFPKSVIEFAQQKMKELEISEILKSVKDLDGESAKKHEQDYEEAQKIFLDFVENVAKICGANMDKTKAKRALKDLKTQLRVCENRYVQAMIS